MPRPGDHCSVCQKEHDTDWHAHRLMILRSRRKEWERRKREQLGELWCGTCKGICRPPRHRRRTEQQRASQHRNQHKRTARQREQRAAQPGYWRKYWKSRAKAPPPVPDYYPYDTDHPLILQANELIPKFLPPDVRADACQEFILAMIEGRKPEVEAVVRRAFAQNRTFAVSLSTPDRSGQELWERI